MGFIQSVTAKFFAEFLEHEGVKVTKTSVEKGTIKNKDKVLISFVPPSKDEKMVMKAKEVSISVNVFEGTYPQQATTDDRSTILTLAQFDDMLNSSKLVESIKSDQRALKEAEDAVMDLRIKKLNQVGGLSDADEKKLRMNQRKVDNAKSLISENSNMLFTSFMDFLDSKRTKFEKIISDYCNKVVTVTTEETHTTQEAFKLNADGDVTQVRFPEKDTEEEDNLTGDNSGWKLIHSWSRVDSDVDKMRGRTLDTFKVCRDKFMAVLFEGYGYAEAQYEYMMNNLRLPKGIPVQSMADMLEKVSSHMYLLPSLGDDPTYTQGELDHHPARNKPFSETAICEMLLESMPKDVKVKWRGQHLKKSIPTDLTVLKKELQVLVDEHYLAEKQQQGAQQQQNSAGGGKNQNGKASSGSRNGGGGQQNQGGGGDAGKYCARCDKMGERKFIVHNHNTGRCKKYDKDLKPISQGYQKQVHQQELQRETPLSDKKKKRKRKKDSKKSKKKKKKKSRKKYRRDYSSSSSSDDDSSSSSDSYSSDSS